MHVPAAWYDALTLAERVALPRVGASDPALGVHRLERWRSRAVFAGNDRFDRRLAVAGVSVAELVYLLGQDADATRQQTATTPAWMDELARLLKGDTGPVLMAAAKPEEKLVIALLQPLVGSWMQRLADAARVLGIAAPQTVSVMLPALLEAITPRVQRTLVLELHAFREQCRPDAGVDDFAHQLAQGSARMALFEEYPVLARQCLQQISDWYRVSLEFLERLHADRDALRSAFSPHEDPGPLTGVDAGEGDAHGRGRRVMVATFASGLRIVYKPRSLAIDGHLSALIEFLNQRGLTPPLMTPVTLDQGLYGWVEFVARKPCHTMQEVAAFYRRLGCWLALAYGLGATDLHGENVVASGSHPVLVDVETLFHPAIDSLRADCSDGEADRLLSDSILGIGILPTPLGKDHIDVSSLGATDHQLGPVAVPVVTSQWRIERRRPLLNRFKNRPTLDGHCIEPSEFTGALEEGFEGAYRLLQSMRDELPLAPFREDTVRVLIRASAEYASLLMESWHPNLLRHGLAREQHFDQLWGTIGDAPGWSRCIASEVAQMLDGDIPHFTTTPMSSEIHGADGARIEGMVVQTGTSVVERRLQRLGPDDLTLQRRLLRKCLWSPADERPMYTAEPAEPLALACSIGDYLVSTAIRHTGTATWITGEAEHPDAGRELRPAGRDLYGGLPGIILFLAWLDAVTPGHPSIYRSLAEDALAQLHRLPWPTETGAFTGLGGYVYLWAHLGTLWESEDLLQHAETALSSFIAPPSHDDLMDGTAGVIACLLALHATRPWSDSLPRAVAWGETLLSRRTSLNLPVQRGFSHGLCGVAWALFRLGNVAADERFRAAAGELFRQEDLLIQASGWMDTTSSREDGCGAWCHGAPGIAIARLQAGWEMTAALQATSEGTPLENAGLCHGELGALEALILASQSQSGGAPFPAWETALVRRREAVGRRSMRYDAHDPGLMTGLAGIGYGLLRLHDASRVPSVLTLAPPSGRNQEQL
ncbi:MAG: type 2 lanthipeptide synthetase LanM family protein [Candidatus Xenobia bacterium]